jgi:hypothetical protein
MSARLRQSAASLLALALLGCENHLPDPPVGGMIRGQLRYGGVAHQQFTRPAVQIAALAMLPPPSGARPHGLQVIENPDFSRPIDYQLANLPEFSYKVVALIADVADPQADQSKLPTGAYPNMCALVTSPQANVPVSATGPTTNIDISVYDSGGAQDPCNKPKDNACPVAGASSLVMVLSLARGQELIVKPDQLIVAVLTDPMAFPTRFKLLPANELASGFPYAMIFNDLPAGEYIVYACYDVNGDNLLGCGPQDFSANYMGGAKLNVPAGKIIQVHMDLDTQATGLDSIEEPAARGCP